MKLEILNLIMVHLHLTLLLLSTVCNGADNIPEDNINNENNMTISAPFYKDLCNKTVDLYEDVTSPPFNRFNHGKVFNCWYKFRVQGPSQQEWVLRFRFKRMKIGVLTKGNKCVGGYLQITDGNPKNNPSNKREEGVFCGETEQMQTFISETNIVKINVYIQYFTEQTYFQFDTRAVQGYDLLPRFGKHPELYPNRRGILLPGTYCEKVFMNCKHNTCSIQSPGYPGFYNRALKCMYYVNTVFPYAKLVMENEDFNVDGQMCENVLTCPMKEISQGKDYCKRDYLKIYDGRDDSYPVIGIFCGTGTFPHSVIGSTNDLTVEFVSSKAGPLLNMGFSFTVDYYPGPAETIGVKNGINSWFMPSKLFMPSSGKAEGTFSSLHHWYKPGTVSTTLFEGVDDEIIRIHFTSVQIDVVKAPIVEYEGECVESLTLYDGGIADDTKIIKTFCDTFSHGIESTDYISSGNKLLLKFESKTGSYTGSTISYWGRYDFFIDTKYGTPVKDTICDEIFNSSKKRSGYLRSPTNRLIYRIAPTENLECHYIFKADGRSYSRIFLTIFNVQALEHAVCNKCWEDNVDKLMVWEPSEIINNTRPSKQSSIAMCLCSNITDKKVFITSLSNVLILKMIVTGLYTNTNDYKNGKPIFEAKYEFIHGPLCGPVENKIADEGMLKYPNYEVLGYVNQPKNAYCAWDLYVAANRDLSMNIEEIKLASEDCKEARLELYFPRNLEQPVVTICGKNTENNNYYSELHIFSNNDLRANNGKFYIQIRFISEVSPVESGFKVMWTSLIHLERGNNFSKRSLLQLKKRSIISIPVYNIEKIKVPTNDKQLNIDGKDTKTDVVNDTGCDFFCPNSTHCLPSSLVCNGVIDCPKFEDDKEFDKLSDEGSINCEVFFSSDKTVINTPDCFERGVTITACCVLAIFMYYYCMWRFRMHRNQKLNNLNHGI